jgi:hypothetical protein
VNDARLSSLIIKTAILAVKYQITVSFVRAAGVLAKGRMFDMPALDHATTGTGLPVSWEYQIQ